jgi:hypothetical protein
MTAGLGAATATIIVFLVMAVRRSRHTQQLIDQGELDAAAARESRLQIWLFSVALVFAITATVASVLIS